MSFTRLVVLGFVVVGGLGVMVFLGALIYAFLFLLGGMMGWPLP